VEDEAEEALERVLRDEPTWHGMFHVIPVLLYDFVQN
jgi:hypothetical protein